MIKLPTPRANTPVKAMTAHCVLPPVSNSLTATLFAVELVVAAEDIEELVLTAFAGPTVPPWTGREILGAFETLDAAPEYSARVCEPSDLL